MKFISIVCVMACVCLMMCCKSKAENGFSSVTVDEFAKCIADTANVMVVDVRTADEYNAGHIDNALNIDVKRNDFEAQANKALPKDKTIAIYCRSGNRSKKAGKILTDNGYKVVELESGYNGWTKK